MQNLSWWHIFLLPFQWLWGHLLLLPWTVSPTFKNGCAWSFFIKSVTEALAPYYKIRDKLTVMDNYILRCSRLIAPLFLRTRVIALPCKSHQGIVHTKQHLRDLYWWPKIDSQVQSCIASWIFCQSNDKTACTHPTPLQPVPLPDGPWKKPGRDIVGPFDRDHWGHCTLPDLCVQSSW